jgi:thiosulfate dehydrogenase
MRRLRSSLLIGIACVALIVGAAYAADQSSAPYDAATLPAGNVGDSIRLGHDIMADPKKYLPKDVVAGLTCESCHINGGTVKRGGSFVGTYGRFPQWNKRAHRMIALQDRLAECFLYSMNGTPPKYNSKEMIAMVSYIAYLSRNTPVGAVQADDDKFVVPLPSASPDPAHGAKLYAANCSSCHGNNGAGIPGAIPPLWGKTSFNDGAGMAHIDRMTGFVRFNMPKGNAGSLSLQDAYDVSSWVLTHDRPKFDKNRLIQLGEDQAKYF